MQAMDESFTPGDHQGLPVTNILEELSSHQLYEQRLGAEDLQQQEDADGLYDPAQEFAKASDPVQQKRKRNCRDCDETEEAPCAKVARVEQSMTSGTTYTTSITIPSSSSSPTLFTSYEQVCPDPPPNGSFEMRDAELAVLLTLKLLLVTCLENA